MPDLTTDLQARWTPSNSQDHAAANVLADKPEFEYVYTAHMLVNKNYGWWTPDVKVVPLTPNVFAARDEVLRFLEGAAEAARVANPSLLFTMGYTVHRRKSTSEGRCPHVAQCATYPCQSCSDTHAADLTYWAVFEDILATSSGDGDN